MRLIDAEALKKDDELTEWLSNDAIRTGKMLKQFSELFIKKIDNAPTVCDIEQIRDEIEQTRNDLYGTNFYDGLDFALEIIDKHIGAEMESSK